jgi:putative FmdB family regulatory protein
MPLYDFLCSKGHKYERQVRLDDFDTVQMCDCGADSQRQISAPMFTVDQTGYTCPITEKWIGSKREHENNLAAHGCRVLEPGEKEESTKSRQLADEAFDKSIDQTVEREIESWDSSKKESLHNELVNGKVDLEVSRGTVV